VRINSYITDEKLEAEDINLNLIFNAKNTNTIDLWCFDEEDIVVDITGATVFFTVKEKPTDSDTSAVLKKDVTVLTNPTSGNTLITTTPTDSASLLGNYLYSIKIKLVTGEIYNLKEGNICFRKTITERTS
jgi:hypothetical protein